MERLKQAQTQLIQSARLAAVGELAAGVAHELNNPLTSVLGFAELLLEETVPEAPAHQDLRTIAAEARRARGIVRRLLDFARQSRPERRPADISQVLQQTLAVAWHLLETSGVTLEQTYDSAVGPFSMDAGQMQQVFLNLISNALQAMPEGGRLSIRTALAGNEVAVSVSDTGEGIPADLQERIFTPFFTTRPSGTGLGLSVSLGIVQEHGGRIGVESEPGRGSTFTVWLPLEQAAGETRGPQ